MDSRFSICVFLSWQTAWSLWLAPNRFCTPTLLHLFGSIISFSRSHQHASLHSYCFVDTVLHAPPHSNRISPLATSLLHPYFTIIIATLFHLDLAAVCKPYTFLDLNPPQSLSILPRSVLTFASSSSLLSTHQRFSPQPARTPTFCVPPVPALRQRRLRSQKNGSCAPSRAFLKATK